MKKLIAKTQEGKEYMHSKTYAFFANTNAQKIADTLNKHKAELKDGEKWHVYDYDFSQDSYVGYYLFISNGKLKTKTI